MPDDGFELRAIADMASMVVIEYVETPEQLESGERKQFQVFSSGTRDTEQIALRGYVESDDFCGAITYVPQKVRRTHSSGRAGVA